MFVAYFNVSALKTCTEKMQFGLFGVRSTFWLCCQLLIVIVESRSFCAEHSCRMIIQLEFAVRDGDCNLFCSSGVFLLRKQILLGTVVVPCLLEVGIVQVSTLEHSQ